MLKNNINPVIETTDKFELTCKDSGNTYSTVRVVRTSIGSSGEKKEITRYNFVVKPSFTKSSGVISSEVKVNIFVVTKDEFPLRFTVFLHRHLVRCYTDDRHYSIIDFDNLEESLIYLDDYLDGYVGVYSTNNTNYFERLHRYLELDV